MRGLRALHEPPAILLEVVPIPVGQNGIEQRNDFLRRFGDFRLKPCDFFLRLVSLNVSFEDNFPRDGFGRLAPRVVLQRALNDGVQFFNRCLRQTFLDRFIDFFPLRVAWGSQNDGSIESNDDEETRAGPFH